jgi:hypothetical protein
MPSSCFCSMVDELADNVARFYKFFLEVGMQAYFYGCTCVCLFFLLLMSSCSGWAVGEWERWVVDQSSIWGVWSPVTNEWPNMHVQHIHSVQLAVNSEWLRICLLHCTFIVFDQQFSWYFLIGCVWSISK